MMKKILCLLAVLSLCAIFPAAAEESSQQPVTAAELTALLESIRTQALASDLLNNPADESARCEDGTLFQYDTARIYADGTELTADTPVNTIVFLESEGPVFRGTGIDMLWRDLLAAYPQENEQLAGDWNTAVLYLKGSPKTGFQYGRVLRDGQRISSVEYGELLPEGEAFRHVSITYSMINGMVTSIRVEGLNPAAGLADAARCEELFGELSAAQSLDYYRQVQTSQNGLELTPFSEEDLSFDGYSYLTLQPSDLPGMPEQALIDNEDGTWLLRCDEESYQAVFLCDEHGENATILSFSLLDNTIEGPRSVRMDDLFSEDFCRFRNGENEMKDDLTELLYGTEDTVPRGTACYDPDNMSLSYVTDTSAGLQVELILKYEENSLKEIILQTI